MLPLPVLLVVRGGGVHLGGRTSDRQVEVRNRAGGGGIRRGKKIQPPPLSFPSFVMAGGLTVLIGLPSLQGGCRWEEGGEEEEGERLSVQGGVQWQGPGREEEEIRWL